MQRRSHRVTTLICLLCTAASCVAFREGPLAPISGWPPSAGGKPSVRVALTFVPLLNGEPMPEAQIAHGKIENEIVAAYVDSGLFSQVTQADMPTDLVARVTFTRNEDSSVGLAVLSGLSLTLIPATGDLDLRLQTQIENAKGGVLGTFDKREVVSNWIQLFLVVVMPFKFPIPVFWDAFTDLNRATLLEARAQGIV